MGNEDEARRLGVLHLNKAASCKRNPKRFKKTNFTRSSLTIEDKKMMRYEQVEPLYQMWCDYFRGLIGDRGQVLDERLLKADYHGALVLVAEAHCISMIGIVGIIVLETRQTFQLITKQDKYVVIPKRGTALQFVFDGRIFTLFGDAMRYKPSLRGKKHRLRVALPFFIR
uniref:Ribonuclease P protein subunit p29 n=1 Tax=Angiostrongylus cantonensis TaxID=6313 RepID=A0A0K0CV62_ANGCA